MRKKEWKIEKRNFDGLIEGVGWEIEEGEVRVIVGGNGEMVLD